MSLGDAMIAAISVVMIILGGLGTQASHEWEEDLHSRQLSAWPARLLRRFGWVLLLAGVFGIATTVYTYWPKLLEIF